MNSNTVSIISPCYNHENYIGKCIESVLAQDHTDWEMIIVNDGSTDRSLEIAKRYAEKDQRIVVINQNNKGIFKLSETYNTALDRAKGAFICILECDDLWEKDKLSFQINIMQQNPATVMAWGRAKLIKGLEETLESIKPDLDEKTVTYFNNNPIGSILNVIYKSNCIPALTMMFRRSVLDKIGGFKQGYGLPLVDYPTILEISLLGPFAFTEKPLGSWRLFAYQVTKTYTVNIQEGFYQLRKDFLEEKKSVINPEVFQFNQKELEEDYKNNMIIAHARVGRYELIRKNFKNARLHYKKAIFHYGFRQKMWKIRALVGYIFSFLHLDVEYLAEKLGKGRINVK